MHRVLLASLLILAAGSARAEDFSGFYAGINAGYAYGRDRTREVTGPVSGGSSKITDIDSGPNLPPSAVGAVASLRRPGPVPFRGAGQR